MVGDYRVQRLSDRVTGCAADSATNLLVPPGELDSGDSSVLALIDDIGDLAKTGL
jgi:hypothetical protein